MRQKARTNDRDYASLFILILHFPARFRMQLSIFIKLMETLASEGDFRPALANRASMLTNRTLAATTLFCL